MARRSPVRRPPGRARKREIEAREDVVRQVRQTVPPGSHTGPTYTRFLDLLTDYRRAVRAAYRAELVRDGVID